MSAHGLGSDEFPMRPVRFGDGNYELTRFHKRSIMQEIMKQALDKGIELSLFRMQPNDG